PLRPAPRSGSGPRSPASTSGPHITAATRGLSGDDSRRSVFGSVSEIESPVFHFLLISTYEPGLDATVTGLPFTFTTKPVPAQDGRRSANVNSLGVFIASFKFADSPSGKFVSIVRLTPADFHSAVDGA